VVFHPENITAAIFGTPVTSYAFKDGSTVLKGIGPDIDSGFTTWNQVSLKKATLDVLQ